MGDFPGWVRDDSGALRRETIHRMTRRCLKWDYHGTGTYLITLVLNDRSRPLFGRLTCPPIDGRATTTADFANAKIELTELGRRVEAHFRRIGEFTPEIEVVGVQMMPEHLHGVLRVVRRMSRPLGEQLRGFKIGASKLARELGVVATADGIGIGEAARGLGLFADGFVDTILGDEAAVKKGVDYMLDNPRRLAVKQAFPSLFKVLGKLEMTLPIDGQGRLARFAAIGNRALLKAPHFIQVQVSRRDFAYRRDQKGGIVRSVVSGRGEPAVATDDFEEKAETLLAAATHGAVLVSPCISEGEREIAARAFGAGHRVITLQNKGFSPLYKPGGKLFEQCAAGNLLMLAPSAWPYLPGEKRITRIDACVLNRIAQLIAGSGAAEINYKGYDPGDVDRLVREALDVCV